MNIGDTLKKLRENNNMTRKEAADKLRDLGIDISDKTLYGYESGRNSANADMFLALCQIYKCKNIMETFSDTVDDVLFTNIEWNMIEKYRILDSYGQETVNIVLDRESSRSTTVQEQQDRIAELEALNENSNCELKAAHHRNDVEFSAEEAESDMDMLSEDNF